MTATQPHIPVLLEEVIATLKPAQGETYIDGTFGAGGYTSAILDAAECNVIGIDRDPAAIERSKAVAAKYDGRFEIRKGCFGDMAELCADRAPVDGIVLDIGVSSPQLDEADRGFSFRMDGPLDMRMGDVGPTAADVVNTMDEEDLANIIYQYGEERKSRRVARAIVQARSAAPITRTQQLAEIVRSVVKGGKDKIDPATRTFQGLRIHVNDELGELKRALNSAAQLLKPNGRLVVVTFHSLEDRIVKEFMRQASGNVPGPSRHDPMDFNQQDDYAFKLIKKKPLAPSEEEIARNPRCRSSRLRYALRTETEVSATLAGGTR